MTFLTQLGKNIPKTDS